MHKTLFFSLLFILHNLIIAPINRYRLITIIIGATIFVLFNKMTATINNIIDNTIKV